MPIQVPPTIQVPNRESISLLAVDNYLHVGSSSSAMQFKFTNDQYIEIVFYSCSASCGPFLKHPISQDSAGAALSNLRDSY